MERDRDRRRSKWPSREGERWWLGALAYGGGALTIALIAAAAIAILMEELWIVLAVAAVVVVAGVAFAAFVNGDWWN